MTPVIVFCLIAALGIGAQWLAWRWKVPAIVLLLLSGVLIGPVTGVLDPRSVFGELLEPLIAVAVAMILFEGGLTLNLTRLKGAELAVKRLVFFGGPLVWLLATLSGHYIGGLTWASASVLGGILIVTGPTVIIPLLRQASLKRRPGEILRWEAILNDPVGALAAVLAFELAIVLNSSHSLSMTLGHMALGIAVASAVGLATAWGLIRAIKGGHIPEFLKVPVIIFFVMATYALPNALLHESGLLAVTVMGVVIGNSSLSSLDEIRRFKENITVLLVSGVFILLAAQVDLGTLATLTTREILFVAVVLLLVRPLAVFISLIKVDLPFGEKLMVGWIGPRGVVAVAIAGLFGARLVDIGIEDAALLSPLAFAIVAVTVLLHGFSLQPLARRFNLQSTDTKGLLIIGANPFTVALAEAIQSTGRPVLIADRNYNHLRQVRGRDIPTYYGEVLTEEAELTLEFSRFDSMVALTDNDDYNALLCMHYAPEFGHHQVYRFAPGGGAGGDHLEQTLGGRFFAKELDFEQATNYIREGWCVRLTRLSESYSFEDYRRDNPDARVISTYDEDGEVRVMHKDESFDAGDGETLLALVPDDTHRDKAERHARRQEQQPTDVSVDDGAHDDNDGESRGNTTPGREPPEQG
ncbi:cation:proton antiporter [Halomonas sp. H10-59]|uniref:Cation:proton antiporter n=1 Tax=Halomonas sp. H10-59 TaxID=2950874 RepID=A0AAU7KY29_9GAMM